MEELFDFLTEELKNNKKKINKVQKTKTVFIKLSSNRLKMRRMCFILWIVHVKNLQLKT